MKRWLIILTVCLAGFSCNKGSQESCNDGYIFWGGDPAVDGVGWYFSKNANGSDFFPLDNLSDDFKIDNLAVNACLVKTNKEFICFCSGTHYYYHINSISLR